MPIFRANPDLLTAFRNGEPEALELVYRTFVSRVRTSVRAMVPVADVSDAVQDTFAKAFGPTARDRYDASRDFEPYLLCIARNVSRDCLRRSFRLLPLDPHGFPDHQASENAPNDLDERMVLQTKVYVEGLSPELREVHELRFVRDLSQRESAKMLGISRQNLRTVEARLQKGLLAALRRGAVFTARFVQGGSSRRTAAESHLAT